MSPQWNAVDLFSGCGGLTDGLVQAGFRVVSAVEKDPLAARTYKANHKRVNLLTDCIKAVTPEQLFPWKRRQLHLIAGCPPCQGFSRVRRRNRSRGYGDRRNWLIGDFQRLVLALKPKTVFLENVPGIERYSRFKEFLRALQDAGYQVEWDELDLALYGVPQRRRRVVVLAGLNFEVAFPKEARFNPTVADAIKGLPLPSRSRVALHRDVAHHAPHVVERIRAVPKDGGSRSDWPSSMRLSCHKRFDGFKDVYGRMSWKSPAPTITAGCINASKGRFLHPSQNRVITLYEAAILQTFRRRYKFLDDGGKYCIAEMIGNALPPEFARRIGVAIASALEQNC